MYSELKAIESFLKIQNVIQSGLQTIAENGLYSESFDCDFNEAVQNLSDEYSVCYGVSKGVLVPTEGDFVFKMSFDGDDCGELFYYDYCNVESKNYKEAVREGVERFFAITRYFDTFKTDDGVRIPVYIQEKVTPFIDACSMGVSNEEYSYYESKAKSYTGTERLPLKWINDFIECYSEEEFDKLGKFLDVHDINDLHSGNVGYDENKYPVIFDFSGYHDFSTDREARELEY